ncbi:MAG: class I SAM-dependent methyltransferase [Lutibacter sp.]
MIEFFKNRLTKEKKLKLIYRLRSLKAIAFPFNLSKLSKIHKSDKFGIHFYTEHYQKHFKSLKFKKINLLEIGVGGYDDPLIGGNSLRMWKSYFPFGKIYSIDIFNKKFLEENRIKIFKGSQTDNFFLNNVLKNIGKLDIIIDDGSHINSDVIDTFKYLFPKLKNKGIYVIEDTQTSYWPDMGGELVDRNNPNTIYGYFKGLIDGINYREFMIENYKPNYLEMNIINISFYHNLIFIFKGENSEKSNVIINGKRKF